MMRLLSVLVFLFCMGLSAQTFALVEFSVGYHGLATNSSGGNWTIPGATMSGAYGLNAELRFELPLTGLGLGLRYGKLGVDLGSSGQTVTMNNDATAALIAYRFINTGFLLGLVGTFSLTNSGTLKNSLSSAGSNSITAGSISHYTAGLELGIKLPILLAVEAGYGNLTMSGFGSQTLSGTATNVNISGPYVRAGAGFSF